MSKISCRSDLKASDWWKAMNFLHRRSREMFRPERISCFGALFAWLAVTTAPDLRAQLVSDGETNVLDNVSTNLAGPLTVGTNGSFTALILTNRSEERRVGKECR